MSAGTEIEWTDVTWNTVTGCSKVSPGCDHCYMFQMYPRLKAMGSPAYQHAPDVVRLQPARLDDPTFWRKPRRVFVNSMSDTFHHDVDFEFLGMMFERMEWEPRHQFQVLTKRPGRAVAFAKWMKGWKWPSNIWLGTSVESDKYAPRIEVLARVPAAIRFVSAEPLLEPLDLSAYLPSVEWVIIGGESGPGARPMGLDWMRTIINDCRNADVPVFVKQLGTAWAKRNGARHPKGGDPSEWPAELRIRQFPDA